MQLLLWLDTLVFSTLLQVSIDSSNFRPFICFQVVKRSLWRCEEEKTRNFYWNQLWMLNWLKLKSQFHKNSKQTNKITSEFFSLSFLTMLRLSWHHPTISNTFRNIMSNFLPQSIVKNKFMYCICEVFKQILLMV